MKYYIGIDLGGTNIVAGVVDENFSLIATASNKTNAGRPADQIAETMAQTAAQAAEKAGISMEQIESVGIGSPGIVDSQKREVIFASNLDFYSFWKIVCIVRFSSQTMLMLLLTANLWLALEKQKTVSISPTW